MHRGLRNTSFCALLLLIIQLLLTGCQEQTTGAQSKEEGRARADLTIQKFHYTEREKGERKWEIHADRAERFLKSARVHMDQVKMNFYLEKDGWIHLSGLSGDYFEKEKRMELSGDVEAETHTGYTLYGDRLVWEQERNLLRSEDPVRLMTAQYNITGDKMTYQADLKKLELTGSIRTVITPGVREEGSGP